jgi:hypothetical protein
LRQEVDREADPAEQANYEAGLKSLLERLKGNASVVMYSSTTPAG